MKKLPIFAVLSSYVYLTGCMGSGTSNIDSGTENCGASEDSAVFSLAPDSTSSLLMEGTIDCTTNTKLQAMLNSGSIDTIIMVDVPGSEDDEANIAMAKIVSGQEITTVVPANGLIASGGVDLFLAGATRIVEFNGIVGVHSWADGDGAQGIALYRNDPDSEQHRLYIDYYDQFVIGMRDGRPSNEIADIATDFYVYTLEAAPAEGLHCMSPQELVDWGVVTNTTDAATLSTQVLGEAEECTH